MFYIIESEDQLERVRSSCNTPTYVDVILTTIITQNYPIQ